VLLTGPSHHQAQLKPTWGRVVTSTREISKRRVRQYNRCLLQLSADSAPELAKDLLFNHPQAAGAMTRTTDSGQEFSLLVDQHKMAAYLKELLGVRSPLMRGKS
jgi:hypothetical protein